MSDDSVDDEILDHLLDFLSSLLSKTNVTKVLGLEVLHQTATVVEKILSLCEVEESLKTKVQSSFKKINSIHKFESLLSKKCNFVKPTQIVVFDSIETILDHGEPKLGRVQEKVVLMPIKHHLRTFFSLPNILDDSVAYLHGLQEANELTHFTQGELWKQIRAQYADEEIVLPLILYADDFEPDNALGGNSGTNKQMGIYYSILALPQHLLSSPDYVFPAVLLPSRLKSMPGGLNQCLKDLVDVFEDLETNGITIGEDENERTVYFVLSLIVGDNLALNELLGFSKSFNSNYFCRFCMASKNETKTDLFIRNEALRTPEQHSIHIQQGNAKETGVYFDCIFHKLKYFHVTRNFYADIFHDVFEGVACYEVSAILDYYIFKKKICSLSMFNQLMTQFSYGETDMSSVPKEFTETQIKKQNLRMSGAQMKTFLHFIPLILGHLIIPTDTDYKYWTFLTELVEIVDLLMESKVTLDYVQKVEILVKNHLETYIELFGFLKPKHHFLLHYIMLLLQVGPLRNLMTFVFEQKNRHLKLYASVTNQRVNLSWSLMNKAAYKFQKFMDEISGGLPSCYSCENSKTITYDELLQMDNVDVLTESIQVNESDLIKEVFSLKYKNKVYKKNFFILLKSLDKKDLYKIQKIFLVNDNYYIIGQLWTVKCYSPHYKSYIVDSETAEMKLIAFDNVENVPFTLHKTNSEDIFYRIKNV